MSWFSSNYEKALLGGGALIALGAAYFGWSQFSAVDEDFSRSLKGRGSNNAAVEGAERIDIATASMGRDHNWVQGSDRDRPVDLFVGIPLFIKRSDPNKAIDIQRGPDVHPGIPNSFWLENHIDPGFGDSPLRDPDADGFNNREEFLAKTDPKDAKSHPELVVKLRYVGDESLAWVLRPGFVTDAGAFPMNYLDGKNRKNKANPANPVKPGELFFEDGVAKGRFKLLGHETREVMNTAINTNEDVVFARIEDQSPNKKGVVYEFPAPLTKGAARDHTKYDRTAILRLEALGQNDKEFKIAENTRFSLPDGGADQGYLLKEVTPQGIVVEYRDANNETKVVNIPKGGLPTL